MPRCVEFFIAMIALLSTTASIRAQPATTPATDPSAAATHGQIYSIGNQRNYWIARVGPNPDAPGGVRTTIQSRSAFSDHWQVISELDSRAVGLANKDEDTLAVLFDTGQWMIVWDGGGAVGPQLPHDVLPLAMAGDGEKFFAIARGHLPALDLTTRPTTESTTAPDDRHESQLGVFELASGQWKLRAIIPAADAINPWSALKPSDISLAMSAGKLLIALRDAATQLRLFKLESAGGLSPLGNLEASFSDADSGFAMLGDGMPRPAVWVGDNQPAGAIHFLDALQSPAKVLAAPAVLKASDGRTIAWAVGGLRLLFAGTDGCDEQVYSASGEPQQGVVPVPIVSATPPDSIYEWITIPLILSISLFLFNPARRQDAEPKRLARRRRESVDTESVPALATSTEASAAEEDFVVIAPLNLRFWAGMVDGLPLFFVAFWVATQPMNPDASFMATAWQWETASLIAIGIYFAHPLVSELLVGRTIGKWMFGLRVLDAFGQKPSVPAVIVRNIIRVPEALLGLPLIAIFLTPLRQRIGDLAANTVVVIDNPVEESDETASH